MDFREVLYREGQRAGRAEEGGPAWPVAAEKERHPARHGGVERAPGGRPFKGELADLRGRGVHGDGVPGVKGGIDHPRQHDDSQFVIDPASQFSPRGQDGLTLVHSSQAGRQVATQMLQRYGRLGRLVMGRLFRPAPRRRAGEPRRPGRLGRRLEQTGVATVLGASSAARSNARDATS